MSKQELYRDPADQNPINLKKVPKEPLGYLFPIETQSAFRPSFFSFLWQLYLAALLAVAFQLAMILEAYIVVFFLALIVYRFLLWATDQILPVSRWVLASAFVVGYVGFFATNFGNPPAFFGLLAFVSLCTMLVAALFRDHWVQRASCGMLSQKTIADFQNGGRLPPGMVRKPLVDSFSAAFSSWLTYDPRGCKSPGVLRVLTGTARTRTSLTFALVILWSSVAVIFVAHTREFLLLPFLLLAAVFLPVVAMFMGAVPILGSAHALIESQFEPRNWRPFTRSLVKSKNVHIKQSLYLGRVLGDGAPINCPTSSLKLGGWIQGPPGSGKTLLLMQLLEQLIWQGVSVVSIDLKATSHELYWSAVDVAQAVQSDQDRHVPVQAFTPTHGKATCLFDLFSQPFWRSLSPEQQASCIIGIFGLNYPCVYPQDWFRDAAWFVQQLVTSKYPNIASFHEAAQHVAQELKFAQEPWELSRQVKEHGEHPRLILQRLGMADAMNRRPNYGSDILSNSIQLESLFHTPGVLHCSLPAVSDPVTNPEIGRVILNSLLHAGAHTKNPSVKVVVLIDEFQRMVSRSIDVVLQQARSSGVGVILTNQNSADLVAVDPNMPGTISGVTGLQAWIKATDSLGVQQVQTFGGQYIDHLYSKSVRNTRDGQETTFTASEHLLDRCSTGLIDRVNSTPNQFFLRLNDEDGYSRYGGQMMVVQSGYHLTEGEYKDLVNRPWPGPTQGMLVNGQHRPPTNPPSSSLAGPNPPKPPRTPTRLAS